MTVGAVGFAEDGHFVRLNDAVHERLHVAHLLVLENKIFRLGKKIIDKKKKNENI